MQFFEFLQCLEVDRGAVVNGEQVCRLPASLPDHMLSAFADMVIAPVVLHCAAPVGLALAPEHLLLLLCRWLFQQSLSIFINDGGIIERIVACMREWHAAASKDLAAFWAPLLMLCRAPGASMHKVVVVALACSVARDDEPLYRDPLLELLARLIDREFASLFFANQQFPADQPVAPRLVGLLMSAGMQPSDVAQLQASSAQASAPPATLEEASMLQKLQVTATKGGKSKKKKTKKKKKKKKKKKQFFL